MESDLPFLQVCGSFPLQQAAARFRRNKPQTCEGSGSRLPRYQPYLLPATYPTWRSGGSVSESNRPVHQRQTHRI